MKVFKLFVISLLSIIVIASCNSTGNAIVDGSHIAFKYATDLTVNVLDSCIVANVRNPWDTARLLQTYVLVPADSALPANLPSGTLVRTPLRNALVCTSVHAGLLATLGVADRIGCVCDAEYIRQPAVRQRIDDGLIVDAGNAMSPDIESIVELGPDAILLSPFENSGGYGLLGKLNVPVIECADYMEVSPLACAEWMRFYGLLFGRLATADSLFSVVERNYCQLRDSAMPASERPMLLAELKSGSAWYVPTGNSTTGRFYVDAGADYPFAHIERTGAVPLSSETVLETAHNADVWLFKYNQSADYTYLQLAGESDLYPHFKAFRNKSVYGCNTSYVPYYDEVPFRPDWLLRDLVKILHPDLLPNHTLRYYSPLKQD